MSWQTRTVFLGAAAALLLSAASCATNRPDEPTVFRLAVEGPLAQDALSIAIAALAGDGLTIELSAPDAATVVISATPSEGADSLALRYWVPVTQLPAPLFDLTMTGLEEMVAGGPAADPLLRVILPIEPEAPLGQWWPAPHDGVERLPMAEIPGALFADPNTLALVPLDAVNAGMRSLAVDGMDVVFGEGDLTRYPLAERVWVSRGPDSTGLDAEIAAVTSALSAQLAAQPPDPINIRATGDILPVRCTFEKLQARGDFTYPFRELGPWLSAADITVGSLDAAVSDAGVPFGCTETFSLMAPAAAVDGFAHAGFDVMTVATNHVKDCGQAACGDDAFFDTLENLRSAGIAPVGGGPDLAAAREPAVLEVNGVRFAFLGYDEIASYYHAGIDSAGTAPLLEEYVCDDVAAAKAIADVVIVLPQWGVEYVAEPTLGQQALAAAAVEAGADLIIGNHPHWVQAGEVIDDVFVAYALGNFLFDQDWSLETQQGVVLEAAFHGAQLRGVRYSPIHIYDETQPRFVDGDEAAEIMERIWDASAALQ